MAILRWAEETARAVLADALPRRWVHVQEVAVRAGRMAVALDEENGEVLHAAAWLHDVGYAPELATTFHPLDGARYLRTVGAPERLVGLVAFHSAAASEARSLGFSGEMAQFEDERSLVRDLLWFADMTIGPGGECMTFDRRMAELQERYAPDHYVVRALEVGIGERRAAVERAERWLDLVGLTDRNHSGG
ncbi:HD domain-containing protein [Pseudonocardia nigra]|uniref:HD domain-containing protein n=1 Tax=Pseudonocardia nigra TaxID=1921578 RepID=UPI001C5DDA0D|nr:HD domain-containing protein [Pseudonocardia nigra]